MPRRSALHLAQSASNAIPPTFTADCYGWIAPTYFIAERGIEAVRSIAGGFVRFRGQNPVRAEFNGQHGPVRILFLSADNPDSILGLGFQGILLDEAARIPADTWQYTIRPTISQSQGWGMFISTPVGRNWFFDLHTRGRDPTEVDYKSWTFPSNANPFFPPEEWEEARRPLPHDVFRQEYMAEFLEDSAGVFRNVEACACLPPNVSYPKEPRVVGADIAKHTDFTVLVAMGRHSGMCYDMERFQRLDWPVQKERILAFVRKHNAQLVLDATGIGDPIYDDLVRKWPHIQPVRLTGPTKTDLIQRLVVAMEQARVTWPSSWTTLTDELKRYEYKRLPSGAFSYNAPDGFHDDCVVSLALANLGRFEYRPAGVMGVFAGPVQRRAWLPCSRTMP